MYQSAASLSALERWQDVVAQNMTSGQVPGYRKRTIEFSTVPGGEYDLSPDAQAAGDQGVPALFPKATNGVSFTAGENQPTGNELDVAIQGAGFFEIQTPDGTQAYTRSGQFSVRADHTLSAAGGEVMSDSGSPIILQPDAGKVTINQDGSVVQSTATGSTVVGKIAVQQFADMSQLIPVAGGMFTAPNDVAPQPVAKPQVLQGYLESSNVAPMHEMVNLVMISRAYEANQKVISSGDQESQKALDALG